MRQKLNTITLGVKSLERSLSFYRDGLGWAPANANQEDVAFFHMEGVVLALYPRAQLAANASVDAKGSGFSGFSLAYNARSEQEVDAVLQTIVRAGGTIVKAAERAFWGGYAGYFQDPDGFLWEVVWNPHFSFDESENASRH